MLPIPLHVAGALVRELLRALALPWHAFLYLLRRDAVQRRTRDLLAHWRAENTENALAEFLRKCPPAAAAAPHVFLSAGEASGETHAARLLRTVAAGSRVPVRCSAFGGNELAEAGADVLVPLSQHAIMGISGALRALPQIVRTYARFLRLLRDDRPHLVVLVDYPGLHLVMARAARRAGVPVLHYVAPQYWAWAPWRIRRYAASVDACLAILPFEPAFFRSSGVPCEYVGHPLLDRLAAEPPKQTRVAELRADEWLCLLPGSRHAEIVRHLPGMLRVARALCARDPSARVLIAHRDERRAPLIREILAQEGADFVEFTLGETYEKLAAARLVLAKSGTGSLEAALFGTPTVVVYRLSGALMSFAYRNYLTVPWFAAANLIAARTVVPECCFHADTGWERVQREVEQLWQSGEARLRCLDQLADVQRRLGEPPRPGEPSASARAAQWVLAALGCAREAVA